MPATRRWRGRFPPKEDDMNEAKGDLPSSGPSSPSEPSSGPPAPDAATARPLSDAARRALAEAAERKAAIDARAAELAREREIDGRGGLDPVRYQDWEVKGIATDF
jgi:hypothetical protein